MAVSLCLVEEMRKAHQDQRTGKWTQSKDGRGVSGNHTNLLPGPIWNYNYGTSFCHV